LFCHKLLNARRKNLMPNAIPHNALIVVADGGKAILFRNDDSSGGLSLREERRLTPKNLQDEGPSGSRPGEQSPSQTDEATFAKQLGKAVNKMKLDGDFNKLVLIADSQTLGQFREVMHKTVEAGLVLTLAKDLTNHSARQITDVILTGSH
jgi:protein required for attachment to host cells